MRLAPLLGLAGLVAAALPAHAGSVDCAERSLGALSRDSEVIALVTVSPEGPERVRLEPVRSLKGKLDAPLSVGLQLESSPTKDARAMAFLHRVEGAWSCLDLILLGAPGEARALSAAVAARLGPVEARLEALFAELLSPSLRLRRDAALDLVPALRVGRTCRKLTAAERGQLLRALAERPSLELLLLSAEVASPELAPALLETAAQAPHPALQAAAARALAASDRARALRVWGRDLEQGKPVERLLGYLGGEAAGQLLSGALASEVDRLRRLTLLCALADAGRARASVLAAVARSPRHPGEARLALAVLARCSEGRALRDLHQALPSEPLQRLAHALRRDPVELARRIQRRAEEELRRLTEEARAGEPKPADPKPADPKPADPKPAEGRGGE